MSPPVPSTSRSFAEAHTRAGGGEDISRILALSDGVFAFAMTLLVLQLVIPVALCQDLASSASAQCNGRLAHFLQTESHAFFAYVLTFLFLGLWWQSHNRVFRFVERYDPALLWLNLFFLITIAIAPFGLGLYSLYQSTAVATMVFAGEQAASGYLLAAIWHYAGWRGLLSPEADPTIRAYLSRRSVLISTFFLASVPLALVDPEWSIVAWVGALGTALFLRRYSSE